MTPIVNGIAQDYQGKVDVRRLNAIGDGKAAFEYYRMLGHPSYILFTPDGVKRWTHVGLITRAEMIEQLELALKIK